jgi:hypothetical protein
MEKTQMRKPMPSVSVGQWISIGPQQIPAIVCNEIPMPEDLFGKHYFVVCKSGQGVRARNGHRLGEAVLITIVWNGSAWAIKEAGFRVSEAMPWLHPYVQQLEGLEHETPQNSFSLEEQIQARSDPCYVPLHKQQLGSNNTRT